MKEHSRPMLQPSITPNDEQTELKAALGNKYEHFTEIGKGAQGNVYCALHRRKQEWHAIKVLSTHLREHFQKATYYERFQREARAIAALGHPNIIKFVKSGYANDMPYIAMEYFNGSDLQRIVTAHTQVPLACIVQVLRQWRRHWHMFTMRNLSIEILNQPT